MSTSPLDSSHEDFVLLESLVTELLRFGGGIERFQEQVPLILRQAIDEVVDARRSGRFSIDEVEKTEKTYLGTKVEILLRNYLKIPKGQILDMVLLGHEVDIKMTIGRTWMIPKESINRPALVISTNEKKALCNVGMMVCKPAYLTLSTNRDKKGQVSASGMSNIWWIMRAHPYPPNFWDFLPLKLKKQIFVEPNANAKVAKLFELVQKQPISRSQIEAIAQQHDSMRRLRKGGGARDILRKKGIAALSGIYDQELIELLGLPRITSEEFISYEPTTKEEIELLRRHEKIE